MSTNTLADIVLPVTISTSEFHLPYDSDTLIPKMNHNLNYQRDIADWKDNAFVQSGDYQWQNKNAEKFQTIVDFSKKVLQNTKDIDSEFVDIVNKNFWELI